MPNKKQPQPQREAGAVFVARMALISSLTALSIDMMLPAFPAIGHTLHVNNPDNLQLLITLFMFGMFFGELIFGPLSDALGRKKALGISVAIYCFGTFAAMCATSIEMLLLGRIVQGIGVSGPKIISRAMIRDQFEGSRMARVMSFVMTLFVCIPMIAPALGQLILSVTSWRGIFVFFLVMAVIATTWIMVYQPETLPVEKRKRIKRDVLIHNTWRILRNPNVMFYTVTAGLTFGIFLLYLSTSQIMFQQMYSIGDSFVLYYALLATGFGIAALLNSKLVMKYGMYRLCVVGTLGLIGVGVLFLVTGRGGPPEFIYFMVGCYVLMFCVGLLFSNLSALAMQPLGKIAGLGASIVSAVSTILAVAISISAGRFYNNSLYPLIVVILISAFISLGLLYSAHHNTRNSIG
ncbi:multidrug effflux MFS transporter [Desulforhopalus sp. 52FAK]